MKNLRAHFENQHTSGEIFQCDDCEAKFRSKRNLLAHKKSNHEQATPVLSCPFCKKLFSKKWNLERHKKLHDVEEATDN